MDNYSVKVNRNIYDKIASVRIDLSGNDYDIQELKWILDRLKRVADEVEDKIFDLEEPPEE